MSNPLFERMEPLMAGPMVHLATVRHRVRANRKILLENHLDFYHLWRSAPGLLGGTATPRYAAINSAIIFGVTPP